ncbi:MBL fold metallo-hydrolase [Yunchengibacter salinarum]|uniref:MBL fold metallo-hydrolase n=1 Tax=Yunchengibacter salinarum TaxID=3133399 RepID=UPI0035B5A2F4
MPDTNTAGFNTVKPDVTAFFDEDTFTVSYVVKDPASHHAAIIDSVLDYDPAAGRTSTASADRLIDHVIRNGLSVDAIMETHVHADHLSAAPYLQEKLGAPVLIGANVTTVQDVFGKMFNAGTAFERDGSQFDRLLQDGDRFTIGGMTGTALHTPGHTPACMTYLIGDAAFVGDTIFMPDYGTARCDFPGGDARTLYESIQKIFAMPDETRIFLCHDYKAPGRDEYQWQTTVGEEKARNIHVHTDIDMDSFVKMRTERDSTLGAPRLLLPSVQVNMRAGHLPPAEDNGTRYIKIPLNVI